MFEHIKRLVKGSSIYGLGNILPKAIGFILIPIYTRYLTTEDYGILAMVMVIHSVLFILFDMGSSTAILRFHFDFKEGDQYRRYLGTMLVFLLGVNLVLLILLQLFGDRLFAAIIKDPALSFSPYIRLGILTTYFSLGQIIPLAMFRVREQAGRYITFTTLNFLFTTLAIIYFVVVLRQGALGSIKGRMYVAAAFFAFYLVISLQWARPALDLRQLRASLIFALPLVPLALANWILTFSDRVLLERFCTLSEVGIYSIGYTIGMIMGDVVRSINKAYVPYFFDIATNEKNARSIIAKVSLVYLVFVCAVGLFGILFSREGVILLTTEKYFSAYRVVPFVIGGYVLHGMYYMSVNGLYLLKRTRVLPVITVLAAALNVGLNLVWIPKWGMMGAAYSTTLSYLVTFLLVFVASQRAYRVPYPYARMAPVLFLFAGAAVFNQLVPFEGIAVPLIIKSLVFLGFVGGLFLFRVITLKDALSFWNRIAGRKTEGTFKSL